MKNKTTIQKFRTAFFGTPDFALPVLQALFDMPEINLVAVFTQPDKPMGRKQILTSPPVKILAEKYNIPVCQPERIKSVKFEQCFSDLELDVTIVVAYGKIIPEKILQTPKHGWLNIHGSLLPKYRGASPIQGAILGGESETGVTLMKIDAGLDTGDIISQESIPISTGDDFLSLHDKLSQLGAEVIKDALVNYLNGKIIPIPQHEPTATKTSIIKKEDGKIDWSKDSVEIGRHIRAYNPWPGAFCKYDNRTVKIYTAEVSDMDLDLKPGEVSFKDNSLFVGCGKGILRVNRLQLEGKKPQMAREFINGNSDFIKAQLS